MNKADRLRRKKAAKKAARKAKVRSHAGADAVPKTRQPVDMQSEINQAVALHGQGQLAGAQAIYDQILGSFPDHPIALHLSGVIAHQSGSHDQAVARISQALAAKPDYAEAHNNLGIVLRHLGRLQEARTHYQKAVSVNPSYAEAHYNLGNVVLDLDGPAFAVPCYRQAVALKPDYTHAHNNLGKVLHDLGSLDEAIVHYEKAISLAPDFVDAFYNFGITLQETGRHEQAMEVYQRALLLKPDYAEVHNNLGNLLKDMGRMDQALDCYDQAVRHNPGYAEAFHNRAVILQDRSEFDKAQADYRAAIRLEPAYAKAHKHLALIKTHREFDAEIAEMEKLYASPKTSGADKMDLGFALSKAFEDLAHYEKAFSYMADANALRRNSFHYSGQDTEAFFNEIKTVFNSSFLAQHASLTEQKRTPVFIVGMPRSGTTLVEQTLASHARVFGCGELAALGKVVQANFTPPGSRFPQSLPATSQDLFSEAAKTYLEALPALAQRASVFTDKMPDNFKYIGLIKCLFPNAKVIHCERQPLDTCLSIFKTDFTGTHGYAYDQKELAHYYRLYEDLMAHWKTVLPDFIFTVRYEEMIEDHEQQTRRLLSFCGLDWDEGCLRFFETKRDVRTASAQQVRRPIFRDGLDRWRHYEKGLLPLREALGLI